MAGRVSFACLSVVCCLFVVCVMLVAVGLFVVCLSSFPCALVFVGCC